jgi:hypothetical protein
VVAWRVSTWSTSSISTMPYSVFAQMRHSSSGEEWWLTCVYGPSREGEKDVFLVELHDLRSLRFGPWLQIGDFNMIYRAKDKNNMRLNQCRMGQFCRFLNDVILKEIHLHGHLFTWSNEWSHPTLKRIDRAFISEGWEELFLHNDLHALASICSNHAPMLLHTDCQFLGKRHFHFWAFWPKQAARVHGSGPGDVSLSIGWHEPAPEARLAS